MTYSKPFYAISAEPAWWSLLLALALIPFSMAACSLLFSFLLILFLFSLIRGDIHLTLPPYVIWLGAYAAFTLISTIFSREPLISLQDNRELFVFFLIPIFQVVIHSRSRLRIALGVVLSSALISALIGIFGALNSGISLSNRLRGMTSHWMTWSGLLMMVFVFFVVWYFSHLKEGPTIHLLIPALLILLTAILFSLTRSMWLGIMVSLGLYLIFRKPRILAIILPLMAVAWLLLPQSITRRITSIVDPSDPTNRDRIHMVVTGWHIFLDYPITGSGPNTIQSVYPEYRLPEAIQDNPHLHNNLLQILAERGIFTALSLLGFLISLLIQLYRKTRREGGLQSAVTTGSLFLVIAFITAGFFEYNWGDTEIQFLLFFFITIPFLPGLNRADDEKNGPVVAS